MLSDVLAETIEQIDHYLDAMPDIYGADWKERIVKLRHDIDALRRELDAPPQQDQLRNSAEDERR
jgi:hypothetical protein